MKYLLVLILFSLSLPSCKKDPTKKAFLYGRLIDGCNGSPVGGQTVQFYRNFKAGNSVFDLDTETKLLEQVTTDEDGYFYFSGDDYTNNNTTSYSNSSVRIQKNTYLVSGNLGKGKRAGDGEESFVHNVGDVLLEGMSVNTNLKIATGGYDSVKVYSSFYGVNKILSVIDGDYFVGNIPDQKLSIKNFWGNENDLKYNLYLRFEFYFDSGELSQAYYQDYFIDQCSSNLEVLFEF